MNVRELPVLTQPVVEPCCAPLAAEVLAVADAETLSRQFAALADPVRLRLLSLLATAEGGAVCACDLVEPVGKSQPTVSHHLKVLTDAGLVTRKARPQRLVRGRAGGSGGTAKRAVRVKLSSATGTSYERTFGPFTAGSSKLLCRSCTLPSRLNYRH